MTNLHTLLFRITAGTVLILGLAGCASTPPPMFNYDFGTSPRSDRSDTPSCHLPPVYVAEVSSPSALSSNLMLYRLLYANDQQAHAYAGHRWNMPPPQLLTQRVKTVLAASGVIIGDSMRDGNTLMLRLELTDFAHYFIDETQSKAQLTVRATVSQGTGLIAQTTFYGQAASASADAPGGASAMRIATDTLINELHGWLCEQTPR